MKTMNLWSMCAFLLVFAGGAFSWIQFVYPALSGFLRATPDANFLSVLRILIDPFSNAIYQGTPFAGWLVLFVAAILTFQTMLLSGVFVRQVLVYLDTSKVAISIISTKMKLTFDTPDMSRATLARDQLMHANCQVQAYRSTASVSGDSAYIEKGSFRAIAEVDGANLMKQIVQFGSAKEIETIEVFREPLRTNFWATFLPNETVYQLRERFKKTLVNRRTRLVHVNEYNSEEAHIQLTALRYPITNVSLEIEFWDETAPDVSDIEAFLIADNLADPISPIEDPNPPAGKRSYTFKRQKVASAALLVTWKNRRLLTYQQQQRQPALPAPGPALAGAQVAP